jgi:hypothetical protein
MRTPNAASDNPAIYRLKMWLLLIVTLHKNFPVAALNAIVMMRRLTWHHSQCHAQDLAQISAAVFAEHA